MKKMATKCFRQAINIIASITGIITLCSSCLRDDKMDDCETEGPVRIYFSYDQAVRITTNNDSIGIVKGIQTADLEGITQIDLYVFDATSNLFVEKYTDLSPELINNTYAMQIDLAPGNYKFVTWGGLKKSDFAIAPVTPVKQGSLFSDFSVNYIFQDDTIRSNIENLYFGSRNDVKITGSDSVAIFLRQDTYTFNLVVGGTALVPGDEYQVVIKDNNSSISFENIPNNAPSHNYRAPFLTTHSLNEWEASRSTLLIDRNRKPTLRFFRNGQPMILAGMTEGLDLVKLLLQYEKNGIQIDFKTMYEFDIRFTLDGDPDDESSISIGVEIGSWNHTITDDSQLPGVIP